MQGKGAVSLVYWASGSGIAKDIRILEKTLSAMGFSVKHVVTRNRASRFERIRRFLIQLPRRVFKREIQIHVEQIHREQFRFGKKNIIIPNPEITDSDLFGKMAELPIVFCKSRRAVHLFEKLGLQTLYTGFTSEDNLVKDHVKDFRKFLHLAGASNFKGTKIVHDLWMRHPEWPELTIIRTLKDCYGNPRKSLENSANINVIERWIPEEELAKYQNTCGIHVCPSEMEGFGHYIVEGLSVGSVIVTTDAPPMNELVDQSCGYCVEAELQGKSYMEDRWSVKAGCLETCIEKIIAQPQIELEEMSRASRARFDKINSNFPSNLAWALNET